MIRVWVGVDPGYEGAIAILGPDGPEVYDTPVESITTRTTNIGRKHLRHEYLLPEMVALARRARALADGGTVYAATEEATIARVGERAQGSASLQRQGFGAGLWAGILASYADELEILRPQTWKRRAGLSTDKHRSLELARIRFPELADQLKRVKDHGRAEALLIANDLRQRHEAVP